MDQHEQAIIAHETMTNGSADAHQKMVESHQKMMEITLYPRPFRQRLTLRWMSMKEQRLPMNS
jgi:hypothetical protein